jgi:mannose-1-phosphate guanylyltransferase/CheY-like chemotaxis protein
LRCFDVMTQALRAGCFEGASDVLEQLGKPCVLIVHYELDVRAALKARLEAEGFTIVAIASLDDAIDVMDRTRFDVVLADVKAARADLVFFVRHRRAGTRIALLCGPEEPRAHETVWCWGTTVCLLRSAPIAALVGVLHALVAQRSIVTAGAKRAWSVPPEGPRPEAQGCLRVIVHAGHGDRVRNVLKALAGAVAPERTTIIALRRDAESVDASIAEVPSRPQVLLEPRDRGSAAGVLLAACSICQSDADATVAVVPAGRRVAPGPAFVETLEEAGRFVNRYPRWILLLGQRLDRRTPGLWIIPDSVLDCSETAPIWRVSALGRGARSQALSDGTAAFRATGVLVAKAARLVSRGRQLLPSAVSALLQAAPLIGSQAEAQALQRAYAVIPRLDMATTMLEPSVTDLAVAEPAGATWIRGLQLIRGAP